MTAPLNIASHLPAMAAKQPHRLAVVFPEGRDRHGHVSYTHYTFRQLDEASDRLARGLAKVGVGRGVRTVLMVKPSLDFFALTFALFKAGAVPVLVDPGMGVRNLGECLAEAEPEAFIGIPRAHIARIVLGWARKSVRTVVTVGPRLFWGGCTLEQVAALGEGDASVVETRAEDVAAILFTSGSTGIPKGAVYTHGIFAAQVELLRQTYGIEPGEIDLPTFPLFALFAPALGMTAIVPDMDFTRPGQVDPRKIVEAIENFGVTTMFGSPALLRRVADHGVQHSIRLPSLRRVISAGAPVPADVLERFTTMLAPGVQVFTPYGATEALPVSSIGGEEILRDTCKRTVNGEGVCVGRPVPPMQVRIMQIRDEPIAAWSDDLLARPGEVGEIVVKGPVVTREYYRRPESTSLAKIADTDGGILHRMGDLGYFDDQGRLWFCGRKSHRVITANGTLFTIPCEGVFNAHPKVLRTALVGVGENGAAQPVLCVELRCPATREEQLQIDRELRELGAAHAHTRDIDTFLFHPSFPVDVRHNAKIFREKLAVWAAHQLKNRIPPPQPGPRTAPHGSGVPE
jgi:acyl-CoA synthetase (AMP-forming)/AMP-acid ligase II